MRAFMIAIVTATSALFSGATRSTRSSNKQQTKNSALRRTFSLSHEEAGHNSAEIGLLKVLKCRWTRHGKVFSQIRKARPKAQRGRCYLIWRHNRRQTKPSRPELDPEDRLRERRARAQERRRQPPASCRAEALR